MALRLTSRPRKRVAPYSAVRWALAATVAASVFSLVYVFQRLVGLAFLEPDRATAVMVGDTALVGRCVIAWALALVGFGAVGLAIDDEHAAPLLRWAPLWLPLVVLPLALVLVAFP